MVPRSPPHNPRFFTKREAARLQGFPECFATGGYEFYRQIGNAVTTPVVCALAGALMCHIDHGGGGECCILPGLAPALGLVSEAMDDAHRRELAERQIPLPDGTHVTVATLMQS